MKKIVLLLAVVAAFGYSCKKDNNQSVATRIAGTWYYTGNVVTQYENGKVQWQNNGGITLHGAYWMQFNADSSGIAQDSSVTTHFTYSINGQSIIFTENGYRESATIKNLNANNLELYFDTTGSDGTEDVQDATLSKTKPQ